MRLDDGDVGASFLDDDNAKAFLETELDHFAATGISGPKDDAKMIDILFKTWRKMSRHAHVMALGIRTFSPRMLGCLVEARGKSERWVREMGG